MSQPKEDMSMAGVMKEFQGLKDKLKGGEDEDGCTFCATRSPCLLCPALCADTLLHRTLPRSAPLCFPLAA